MRHRSTAGPLRRFIITPLAVLTVLLLIAVQFGVPGGFAGATTMWRSMSGGLLADQPTDAALAGLRYPDSVSVSLYAEGLVAPRFMVATDGGALIVASSTQGELLALNDTDGDGCADRQATLLSGLEFPQGLALHDGQLYYSEQSRISRATFDPTDQTLGDSELLIDQLPAGNLFWSHNTKPLGISPQGRIHYTIGSPCNACIPDDPRFSTMESIALNGSDRRTEATGLRNSIGMDWTPWSGQLYATENSRDLLGDNLPNDELNAIELDGFYGWPYFYTDARYGGRTNTVRDSAHRDVDISALPAPRAPAFTFNPHNAPLGIHFLRHPRWAAAGFSRSAVVALHGSWNRSELDGYKVVLLRWDENGNVSSEDFISGFLTDGTISGRPTAFAEDRDGNLYLSDDAGGRIYTISPNN